MNIATRAGLLGLLVLYPACRCSDRLVARGECEADDTRACESSCGQGVQRCEQGYFGACEAPAATDVSCGVGACARVVSSCDGACVPGEPTDEVCDGLDNDCDGEVDEGLPMLSCGMGRCANEQPSCVGGTPATCAAKMPGAEVCDGVDNDCDGTVDEDLLSNVSADQRVTRNDAASDYVYSTWGGGRLGVAWVDRRDGNDEIYFAALDARGQRMSPMDRRLTNGSAVSTHPAVAWTGSHFLVVWAEGTGVGRDLWLLKVASDGAPMGSAVQLTTASGLSDWPDVVWTGSELAVAWQDDKSGNADIYFARYDVNGNRLGAEVRVTTDSSTQRGPVLKRGSGELVVVWTDHRHGSANLEIYAHRLGMDGSLLGSDVRVSNAPGESSWPDLTWDGGGWAIAWQDERYGDAEIFVSRFTAALTPLGETRVTNASGVSGYPSIDWNGTQYGLSWNDDRGGSAAVYFTALSPQGVKTGGDMKVSTGGATSLFTTAVWTGSFYAFLWKDTRDGPNGNSEVYFAQVGCPSP